MLCYIPHTCAWNILQQSIQSAHFLSCNFSYYAKHPLCGCTSISLHEILKYLGYFRREKHQRDVKCDYMLCTKYTTNSTNVLCFAKTKMKKNATSTYVKYFLYLSLNGPYIKSRVMQNLSLMSAVVIAF